MKKRNILFLTLISLGLFVTSCDDSNDPNPGPNPEGNSQFIIAATPSGSVAETTDYVLQTNQLDTGKVSTIGYGIEQKGFRYYAFHKNRVFSMLYGQGNPGAVTTYVLDSRGILTPSTNLQTETVQVFGGIGEEYLIIKVPRSGDANAQFFRIDANNPKIIGSKEVDIVKLAGNGERAHFTGAFPVDDKVYIPYMCIKGVANEVFHTDYTDSTWIAVFSYPGLELERIIRDNRTSYIGYYMALNGLKQIENGDVYAFSGAVQQGPGVIPSTKPSAAVRIKKGATEFDKDYFFNIQEKSGGRHLSSECYFGNGNFLLTICGEPGVAPQYLASGADVRYAIVNVFDQSFKWVEGIPENKTSISRYPYAHEDKENISIGITTSDKHAYIYTINVKTAKATKGLEVEANEITAIGKLTY